MPVSEISMSSGTSFLNKSLILGLSLMMEVNDLTIGDIRKIQADYLVAAKKIAFAGFDGIQLNQLPYQ